MTHERSDSVCSFRSPGTSQKQRLRSFGTLLSPLPASPAHSPTLPHHTAINCQHAEKPTTFQAFAHAGNCPAANRPVSRKQVSREPDHPALINNACMGKISLSDFPGTNAFHSPDRAISAAMRVLILATVPRVSCRLWGAGPARMRTTSSVNSIFPCPCPLSLRARTEGEFTFHLVESSNS